MFLTSSVFSDFCLIGIVAVFFWHFRRLARTGRWTVFDPLNFFWAGVFVIYVIDALSNHDAYSLWYGESVVEDALMWTLFGVVFVHIGYHIKTGARFAGHLPELPEQLARAPFLWVGVIFTLVGVCGWILLIESAGGISSWAGASRGAVDWEITSGYLGTMADFLYVGVFLLLLYAQLNPTGLMMRGLTWLLLGALLLFYVYLGSRSRTILLVLAALMAWNLPRGRSPSMLLLTPVFIALLLVTNFQAQYRDRFKDLSFNFEDIDWQDVPKDILPRFVLGSDSPVRVSGGSEFSITATVISLVPEQVPYALGAEFLQFFTHPIPRAWWPGKRYPKNESWTPIYMLGGASDYWVDHVEVPFLAGPAPGFTASWYYNGGALGLMIGGVLVGIMLRTCRGVLDRAKRSQSYFLIYFLVAPIGFGEAVSHPFGFIYSLPLLLLPLVALLYLIRKSAKERDAMQQHGRNESLV